MYCSLLRTRDRGAAKGPRAARVRLPRGGAVIWLPTQHLAQAERSEHGVLAGMLALQPVGSIALTASQPS